MPPASNLAPKAERVNKTVSSPCSHEYGLREVDEELTHHIQMLISNKGPTSVRLVQRRNLHCGECEPVAPNAATLDQFDGFNQGVSHRALFLDVSVQE